MEKIGKTLSKGTRLQAVNTDVLLQAILSDSEISNFIAENQLNQDEIKKSLPKFNQFRNERAKFQSGAADYIAKGYQPVLTMNEGYADVSYRETEELKLALAKQDAANRINLLNLPKSYKNITFEDIYLDDIKRMDVFQSLVDFVVNFPKQDQKGFYLYGDMGVGKSFLMAALAHELAEKKAVSTTMLHFPSFAIDIRNTFKTDTFKEELDAVKSAPVLIFDDIGAEQTTSWLRDEVLQVVLQYRMLEDLPTFFTSNYGFSDLEKKIALGKSGDETWQAKRVMERIKYLAKDIHLQGENRR